MQTLLARVKILESEAFWFPSVVRVVFVNLVASCWSDCEQWRVHGRYIIGPRYLLSEYASATLESLKQWLLLPGDWHKIYLLCPAKGKHTPSPALPKRTNSTTLNQNKNNSTLFLFWPPLLSKISIESPVIHFRYKLPSSILSHPGKYNTPPSGCLWHDHRPWGCGEAAVYTEANLINNKSIKF